jgi:hypothetical protein
MLRRERFRRSNSDSGVQSRLVGSVRSQGFPGEVWYPQLA